MLVLQPQIALVWALPASLVATKGIDFSFFSSRYLDISVPWVYLQYAMYSRIDTNLWLVDSSIRKSPIRCLLTAPRGISLFAASFIGSKCLGIHHTLLFV